MLCCTNSMGSESRYYFKEIVYQGSTEQDTVASALMAIVKRFSMAIALNISMTETVMSTSRVALSKSIHISTANSVKYSRGAYFSYEQFYCDLEIPLSFLCGLQTPGCY